MDLDVGIDHDTFDDGGQGASIDNLSVLQKELGKLLRMMNWTSH